MSKVATALTVRPMSPQIGAEISGINLNDDVNEDTVQQIRSALLTHKVIFFRDQDISRSAHIEFARRFGSLEIHPATPKDQVDQEVLRIEHGPKSRGSENMWHSDVTWREAPSLGSILRSVEVPPSGGDTLFANMNAAYEGLSPALKEWVCTLSAVHDIARVFAKKLGVSAEELHAKYPPQEHPVVRTHPETGQRILYVNGAFTDRIVGLSPKENTWLLDHLFTQASLPEYQCRFVWEPNSIAFWDNRACQHYAASDYFPQVRIMERVTVAGDKPYFDPASGSAPPRPLRQEISAA
jgi:taurine dioxygenase